MDMTIDLNQSDRNVIEEWTITLLCDTAARTIRGASKALRAAIDRHPKAQLRSWQPATIEAAARHALERMEDLVVVNGSFNFDADEWLGGKITVWARDTVRKSAPPADPFAGL